MSQDTSDVRQTLPTTKLDRASGDGLFDSASPTDRSGPTIPTPDRRPSGDGFEGMSTGELRQRMFDAARNGDIDAARLIRRELQERALERRADERLREERNRAREQADEDRARLAGYQCELTAQGCMCEGRAGREHVHQRFLEDLRRPLISNETKEAVRLLLGYPLGTQHVKRMFSYSRGGGAAMPGYEWAAGALEEDWLEVIEIAERKRGQPGGPRVNPRDGGVSDGWVRVVLQQVIERRRRATARAEVTA